MPGTHQVQRGRLNFSLVCVITNEDQRRDWHGVRMQHWAAHRAPLFRLRSIATCLSDTHRRHPMVEVRLGLPHLKVGQISHVSLGRRTPSTTILDTEY
jgi:hypothetical protein